MQRCWWVGTSFIIVERQIPAHFSVGELGCGSNRKAIHHMIRKDGRPVDTKFRVECPCDCILHGQFARGSWKVDGNSHYPIGYPRSSTSAISRFLDDQLIMGTRLRLIFEVVIVAIVPEYMVSELSRSGSCRGVRCFNSNHKYSLGSCRCKPAKFPSSFSFLHFVVPKLGQFCCVDLMSMLIQHGIRWQCHYSLGADQLA